MSVLWVLLGPMVLAGGPLALPPPGQQVTVEIPVFEGGEGMDFFIECARAYEQQVPQVTVNGRQQPSVAINLYGDPRIADKVRVRVLEGTFPAATNAFINYWPLIKHGDIQALDEWMDGPNWEGDSTWRDSFVPGALDVYNVDGHVYGVPFLSSVFCLWYNKTMFREHGWELPRTWDELYALCDKIRAAGVPPFAFQGRYPTYAQALLERSYYDTAGRERYYDMKNLVPGCFDNPEFVEGLIRTRKLARNYFQEGCLGMSHTESQQEFFNGKTAMIPCGAWLKSEMTGKIPDGFELGSFNLPIVPAGIQDPSAVVVGTNYYFVFSRSADKQYAADFLRFMTSRAQAGKFSRMRDCPTLVKGASEGNVTSDMDELVAMVNSAKEIYGQPPGEGYPEMTQHITDFVGKLVSVAGQGGGAAAEADDRAFCADLAKQYESAAQSVRYRAEHPDQINMNRVVEPVILLGLLVLGTGYWAWTAFGPGRARARAAASDDATTSSALRLRWPTIVLFVGPALLLYTVFIVWPALQSFGWSLTRWNGLTEKEYCGLNNFAWLLFDSRVFWTAVKNNLFLMLVIPVFVLPLSLFLAACLSRGLWGSQLFRVVFFFPNLMGSVAVALLWQQLYNPHGPVTQWLGGVCEPIGQSVLGIAHGMPQEGFWVWVTHLVEQAGGVLVSTKNLAWLSPTYLYKALVPMSVWGGCGFNMILYLAAMESIPQSLYEAAEIDGAPAWKQFWQITFPLIWDTLAVSIVFSIIGGMKVFDIIWLLTNQQTPSDLHVVGTYMVSSMFTEYKVGQATAIAVLLFLMVFVGTAATLRAMRRERVEL